MENNTTITCRHCGETLDIRVCDVYPTNRYNIYGKIVGFDYSVYCKKCNSYTKASKRFVESILRK